MNISTKIKMMFACRCYSWNKNADKLLMFLIKHGTNVRVDMINCHIEYENYIYTINLLGFPNRDLTKIVKTIKSSNKSVYSLNVNSSVRTRIKFWDFLEKHLTNKFIAMYYGE